MTGTDIINIIVVVGITPVTALAYVILFLGVFGYDFYTDSMKIIPLKIRFIAGLLSLILTMFPIIAIIANAVSK